MKTRKNDNAKAPTPRPKRPEMRAPRPAQWEPIPLQIPVGPPPQRRHDDEAAKAEKPARGVTIIQYGDES